jgi:hypothetical protein
MRVMEAPAVLTIQLKRFHYGFFGGGKVNKFVQFGEVLNLAPFVSVEQVCDEWLRTIQLI